MSNKDADNPTKPDELLAAVGLGRSGSADWKQIADKLADALQRAKMYIPLKHRYQAQDHLAARLALEDYASACKPNSKDDPRD